MEEKYREEIDPIQCAHWTLFSEKYKYRQELDLDKSFCERERNEGNEGIEGAWPSKKVKREVKRGN